MPPASHLGHSVHPLQDFVHRGSEQPRCLNRVPLPSTPALERAMNLLPRPLNLGRGFSGNKQPNQALSLLGPPVSRPCLQTSAKSPQVQAPLIPEVHPLARRFPPTPILADLAVGSQGHDPRSSTGYTATSIPPEHKYTRMCISTILGVVTAKERATM